MGGGGIWCWRVGRLMVGGGGEVVLEGGQINEGGEFVWEDR